MARVAMGDVWDDSKAFVTREAALLFPLAFATLGVAALLLTLGMPDAPAPDARGRIDPALLSAWFSSAAIVALPAMLLAFLGNLAISLLVLRPGETVAEALRGGFRRLAGALLTNLLIGAAVLFATLVVTFVLMIVSGGRMPITTIWAIMMPVLLLILARSLVTIPMLASVPPTFAVIPLLRRAVAMTRGHTGRIATVVLLFLIASTLVVQALQFGLGSVLLLVGRAAGLPGLGPTLTAVAMVAVYTALQAFAVVFQAMLLRRLAG